MHLLGYIEQSRRLFARDYVIRHSRPRLRRNHRLRPHSRANVKNQRGLGRGKLEQCLTQRGREAPV